MRMLSYTWVLALTLASTLSLSASRNDGPSTAVCGTAASGASPFSYTVVHTYPHDPQAFTEGLEFDNGALYEGTGLEGESTLRRVNLETGTVEQSHALDKTLFGEGITIFGNKIFQLTWQSRLGFVYNKTTFTQAMTFTYSTEGWGLTHDDTRLIMSDGTATLTFLDPQTLQPVSRVAVTDAGEPVQNINELEYIKGAVYANIWQTNCIARIDPQSGRVTAWIDLTGLLGQEDRAQPVDVLNGIAYDTEHDRLFVTGKLWPKLFEITLVPQGYEVLLPVVRRTT